jgi:hypothetical protein
MKALLKSALAVVMTIGAVNLYTACSAETAEAESGEDAITSTECKIINVKENRPMTAADLKKLNDPIAKFALAGKGCPKTFSEAQNKMKVTDKAKCQGGGEKDQAGITTRFVSERSQIRKTPDSYRAVVTRECGGRTDHELFISLFGIGANDKELPNDFEAIGKDATSGVFNYYAREEGQWKFFGNSLDLIADGYDCKEGACTPKAAAKTRCAGCHVGGGLIMKELNSPWVNWEGDTQTPGTDDLIKKHAALLGAKGDGIDMEGKVSTGNDEYVQKRIEFLKDKGLDEVLRPLFCTVDINLQSVNGDLSSIPTDLLLDPAWSVFDSPEVSSADYKALAKQFNQRISDRVDPRTSKGGAAVKDKSGKEITDTFFNFTFPERSHIDQSYVNKLVELKIVDDDFVKDVLHVDFTRPIFSKARCDLLKFAPKLSKDQMKPDAIRDGFAEALKSDASPAAKQLLANLKDTKDADKHVADVNKFIAACKARPKKELLADVLTYTSHVRRLTRANIANSGQGIIEFPEAMVVDDIPDSGNKGLDPATCKLQ